MGQEIKLKIQPLQSNTEGRRSNLHRFLSESCGCGCEKDTERKKSKLQN